MSRIRPLVFLAGVALAAVTIAAARERGGATTYAGDSIVLAASLAVAIVALAAAATTRWVAAAAAVAVTLPVWAGTAGSPALRALAEAFAPVIPVLLIAVAGRARAALVATTAIVVGVRLLLRDPHLDVHCFADCLASPFVVIAAPALATAVDVASGAILFALVLLAVRDHPDHRTGPLLLAAGLGLGAVGPDRLAYGLMTAAAAVIGASVVADAVLTVRTRRAVQRLARDLRTDATRDDLQDALRRLTRDAGLVVTPDGQVIGANARRLERALGPSMRLALANATLRARSEQRVARLRATRERIVTRGDAARQSLERNLHDGAQQGVLAVLYELRLQATRARGTALAATLDSAAAQAATALEELRELAHGIHPRILIEGGLRPALRQLPADVDHTPTGRYAAAIEATVYRVVDEAVQNAEHQRIAVSVVERDGTLVATVRPGAATPQLHDLVAVCSGTVREYDGGFEVVIPCV